jgi:hypothetical protein
MEKMAMERRKAAVGKVTKETSVQNNRKIHPFSPVHIFSETRTGMGCGEVVRGLAGEKSIALSKFP